MSIINFNINDPNSYEILKKNLSSIYPWVSVIGKHKFVSMVYDLAIINKGIFSIIDLKRVIDDYTATKLIKRGLLIQVSSDDETLSVKLSKRGFNRIINVVNDPEIINGYDIYLLFIFYLTSKLFDSLSDEFKLDIDKVKEILVLNGVYLIE